MRAVVVVLLALAMLIKVHESKCRDVVGYLITLSDERASEPLFDPSVTPDSDSDIITSSCEGDPVAPL